MMGNITDDNAKLRWLHFLNTFMSSLTHIVNLIVIYLSLGMQGGTSADASI